jgi:hypothetical protein
MVLFSLFNLIVNLLEHSILHVAMDSIDNIATIQYIVDLHKLPESEAQDCYQIGGLGSVFRECELCWIGSSLKRIEPAGALNKQLHLVARQESICHLPHLGSCAQTRCTKNL